MDDNYIKDKLTEWNLSKWIPKFLDEDIDKHTFLTMPEEAVSKIISTVGGLYTFISERAKLNKTELSDSQVKVSSAVNDKLKESFDLVTITKNSPAFNIGTTDSEDSLAFSSKLACTLESQKKLLLTEGRDIGHSSPNFDTHVLQSASIIDAKLKSSSKNPAVIRKSHSDISDLKRFLESSIDGQIIINFYKKNNSLDESRRRKLTELIITTLMFKNFAVDKEIVRLVNSDFDNLSQQIVNLFPNEKKPMYYVSPKTEGLSQKVSKGKLPDFYRNKLEECRQNDLIKKRKKNDINDSSDSDEESNLTPEAKRICLTHLQWLKYNTAPWSAVIEHWNASRPLRQEDMKNHKNVLAILDKYPVLQQELGYTLFESDYNVSIVENSNIFVEWPQFSKKLEKLIEIHVKKDKTFATKLQEIKLFDEGQECRNAALLSLIPVVCPSNARLKKAGDKKIWRPTVAESIEGFICHVKTPAELNKKIRQRKTTALQLKQPLLPYIIAVGKELTAIDSIYISMNEDVLYKIENILKAVDVTYKIFQVLDTQYPRDCEQVWIFIQQYIYGRLTDWDKHDKSVMNLIDKLKNV